MFGGYEPSAIAFSIGPLAVHWYGMIMVAAVVAAFFIAQYVTQRYNLISKKDLADLAFYIIIFGWIGARLYHVIGSWSYYLEQPLQIFAIWNGGFAIHGGLIAGALVAYVFCNKRNISLVPMLDVLALAVVTGQIIGRWGNFFNQELFGRPTSLPWKIFISPENRIAPFLEQQFFHPVFLYESLLNLVLLVVLMIVYRKAKLPAGTIALLYIMGYSIIRFVTEFIRIEPTPELFGLRAAQLMSIVLFVLAGLLYWWLAKEKSRA